MAADDTVQLLVESRVYEGWSEVSIDRAIDRLVGSFSVKVSEKHPDRPPARELRPGLPVTVRLGGEPVITGHIDDVGHRVNAGEHSVSVRGRDAAADLVDCAPDLDPNEWTNIDLERLAEILCKPFGIPVRIRSSAGAAFPKIALNPGQRAWDLLEERTRYRSVVIVSDGLGGIEIVKPGSGLRADALELPGNVLSASLSLTRSERFSEYIVRGQAAGTDTAYGDVVASPGGRSKDLGVTRFRPLVIVSSSTVDSEKCGERARWEATVRAGRSERVSVTVQGWRQRSGTLWAPNQTARVHSASLGISSDLIVSGVRNRLSVDSATTELTLVRPDTFAPEPGEAVQPSDYGIEDLLPLLGYPTS